MKRLFALTLSLLSSVSLAHAQVGSNQVFNHPTFLDPAWMRTQMQLGSLAQANSLNGLAADSATNAGRNLSALFGDIPSIKTLGAKGDGIADDGPAFTAAFANTASNTFFVPPGTYRIACGRTFTASSAVSFIGSATQPATILFDPGCSFATDIFKWDGQSGVRFANLAANFNNPVVTAPSGIINGFGFYAYSGFADRLMIENNKFTGLVDRMFGISVAAAGGKGFSDARVLHNTVVFTPGTVQNQCIGTTTNGGAGSISDAQIVGNHCVGSGVQFDGSNSIVAQNDISGYKFGTAIFTPFDSGSFSNMIVDNLMHDAPNGVDSSGTTTSCMEIGSNYGLISGNQCHDVGGGGIQNSGNGNTISNNLFINIGKNGPGALGGVLDVACVGLYNGHSGNISSSTSVLNNRCQDTGPGTVKYGIAQSSDFTGQMVAKGNDLAQAVTAQALIVGSTSYFDGPQATALLGTCDAAHKGSTAIVTDANAPTYGGTVAGGGTAVVGAICTGTVWVAR